MRKIKSRYLHWHFMPSWAASSFEGWPILGTSFENAVERFIRNDFLKCIPNKNALKIIFWKYQPDIKTLVIDDKYFRRRIRIKGDVPSHNHLTLDHKIKLKSHLTDKNESDD